jgi:hypothetical protein
VKYADGKPVLLGDKVGLGGGMTGIVVAVIDSGKYSDMYPASEWSYLLIGALIESKEGGVIHHPNSEGDLELLGRASTTDL